MPFFSIITATFNAEASLPVLLDSLVGQTCRDFELVIQDNASRDGTVALARSRDKELPGLSLVSEPDSGIYDAWNKAVERAHGKWLLFLGADDCLHGAASLEHARRLLEGVSEEIHYLGCSLLIATEGGRPVQTITPSQNARQSLPEGMALPHPALLYRRDIFKDNAFSTEFKIAGDYEFLCRTLSVSNFTVSDLVLSCMRVGGVSASPASMLRSERECLEVSRRFFPEASRFKLYARIFRSVAFLVVDRVAGRRAALTFGDRIRFICGKAPLWTREEPSNGSLPVLPENALVSLLIATYGRQEQVRHLIESLNCQKYRNFEVLVADQNPSGYLDPILGTLAADIPIRHVTLPQHGVSNARNAVFEQARGDIIAFPDDDCRYLPETLDFVVQSFGRSPHLAGILVAWSDVKPEGTAGEGFSLMSRKDTFYDAGTLVQFYRRQAAMGVRFDPTFGPGAGTSYVSGEDTDYLLQIVENGWLVGKTRQVFVLHPKPAYTDRDLILKTKGYALGRMQLLRKHNFSILFKLINVFYPLCRIFCEKPEKWRYRIAMFKWRLRGLWNSTWRWS